MRRLIEACLRWTLTRITVLLSGMPRTEIMHLETVHFRKKLKRCSGAGLYLVRVEGPQNAQYRIALDKPWSVPYLMASASSSIQCFTGRCARVARCIWQPMLAVAITSGASFSSADSLFFRSRCASSACRME